MEQKLKLLNEFRPVWYTIEEFAHWQELAPFRMFIDFWSMNFVWTYPSGEDGIASAKRIE